MVGKIIVAVLVLGELFHGLEKDAEAAGVPWAPLVMDTLLVITGIVFLLGLLAWCWYTNDWRSVLPVAALAMVSWGLWKLGAWFMAFWGMPADPTVSGQLFQILMGVFAVIMLLGLPVVLWAFGVSMLDGGGRSSGGTYYRSRHEDRDEWEWYDDDD